MILSSFIQKADQLCSLVEGNVITIEPGCYVPASNSFPKAFQGLGIRIEVSEGRGSPYMMIALISVALTRMLSLLRNTARSIYQRPHRKRSWTWRGCAWARLRQDKNAIFQLNYTRMGKGYRLSTQQEIARGHPERLDPIDQNASRGPP